jgi:hypothetical protein
MIADRMRIIILIGLLAQQGIDWTVVAQGARDWQTTSLSAVDY